jgi:hypothetical protein
MNGLFYTTPITAVTSGIAERGGTVLDPQTGTIDQMAGLEKAATMGFKRIAVTVNGFTDEDLSRIPEIEKEHGITAVCIVVCTTAAGEDRVDAMRQYADLVWSCASGAVREMVGAASMLQITLAIPVFVLTVKGLEFTACYADKPEVIRGLDHSKQHLMAGNVKGTAVTMGTSRVFVSEAELPKRSNREPR